MGQTQKHQNWGVPYSYFMPRGCHNLNFTPGDMGKFIYISLIFAGSPKRWEILKVKVLSLPIKPLSETRWECHVESVKAICYQTSDIRDALLEVAEDYSNPKIKSEAKSPANDLQSFEFIMSIVIRYDILFAVNTVSKTPQSRDMQLDVALLQLNGLT